MSPYRFQLQDFALSDSGVHLLRNRFNFKTIEYEEIKSATIKKATEIRNASVILAFGIALICFAFYQCRWIVELFTNPQVFKIYIETIIIPIFPAFLGVYCIYIAVRKGPVLQLEEGNKKYRLRLHSIVKNNLAIEFEKYLGSKLGLKLIVDGSMR
jgi:hypothetical protein